MHIDGESEEKIKAKQAELDSLKSADLNFKMELTIEEDKKRKAQIDILKAKDKLYLFKTPEELKKEIESFEKEQKRLSYLIKNNIPVPVRRVSPFSVYRNWHRVKESYGAGEEKPVVRVNRIVGAIVNDIDKAGKVTEGKSYEVVGKTYEETPNPLYKNCRRIIIRDDNNKEIKISNIEQISLQKLPGKFDIKEDLSKVNFDLEW